MNNIPLGLFANKEALSKSLPEGAKAREVKSQSNDVIWHTDIKNAYKSDKTNEKLGVNFVLRNIRKSGFSIKDADNDKLFSKEQQNFLIQNQVKKQQIKNKDGSVSTAFVNQGPDSDKKITKGEIENIFKLKESLEEKATLTQLSQEEKDFLSGFNKTFGAEGEDKTLSFEADYQNGIKKISVYGEVGGAANLTHSPNPSDEKNIRVDMDQDGVVDQEMMSEKELINFNRTHIGSHIDTLGTIQVKDNYISSREYKDVDDYIENMPKEIAKKITEEQDAEIIKQKNRGL